VEFPLKKILLLQNLKIASDCEKNNLSVERLIVKENVLYPIS
jgi:hypothetical protein